LKIPYLASSSSKALTLVRKLPLPAVLASERAWKKVMDFSALGAWLFLCLFLTYATFKESGLDFRGYYAAARVLASGGNPYDYHQVAAVLLSVTGHMGNNPFYYPPWFGWCFTSISWLPFQTARAIWLIFNIAVWILSLWQLSRLLDWPEPGLRRWLMFLLATSVFAGITLPNEQIGLLLFALFVAFISAVRSKQWNASGVWLALLLMKPNITLIPVIAVATWLARRGTWRPAVVMCLVLAALLLATTLATPDWYKPFSQPGFDSGLFYTQDGPNHIIARRNNAILLNWLEVLRFPAAMRTTMYAIVIIAGVLSCIYSVWKSQSLIKVLSVSLLASYAITPYAVQYDYPPLAIIWFMAGASSFKTTNSQRWMYIISILAATIVNCERPISNGYWILIAFCCLELLAWWYSDAETVPKLII